MTVAFIAAMHGAVLADPPERGPTGVKNDTPRVVSAIVVPCDLDADHVAVEIASRMDAARTENAAGVVLELAGGRWRSDVVWSVIERLRASDRPVAVYLRDPGAHRVGVGQLMVGIASGRCFIDPETSVKAEPGDDRAELSPDHASWSAASAKLARAMGDWPGGRGLERLPEIFTGVGRGASLDPAWLVTGGPERFRLERAEPTLAPGERSREILTRRADSGASLTLSAQACEDLGVAVRASSIDAVLAALELRGRHLDTSRIDADTDAAHESISAHLRAIDETIEQIKAALDLPGPPDPKVSSDRYRRAAQDARTWIGRARDELAACESLARDFPELLRGPAPGQTSVGGKPSTYATRWRTSLQGRRDKIEKLSVKATAFEARK